MLRHVKNFRDQATEVRVPQCKTKINFDFVKEPHTKQVTCQIKDEFFQVCHVCPSPAFLFPHLILL